MSAYCVRDNGSGHAVVAATAAVCLPIILSSLIRDVQVPRPGMGKEGRLLGAVGKARRYVSHSDDEGRLTPRRCSGPEAGCVCGKGMGIEEARPA